MQDPAALGSRKRSASVPFRPSSGPFLALQAHSSLHSHQLPARRWPPCSSTLTRLASRIDQRFCRMTLAGLRPAASPGRPARGRARGALRDRAPGAGGAGRRGHTAGRRRRRPALTGRWRRAPRQRPWSAARELSAHKGSLIGVLQSRRSSGQSSPLGRSLTLMTSMRSHS